MGKVPSGLKKLSMENSGLDFAGGNGYLSEKIRNVQDEFFGLFPADAGIGDGFAEAFFVDLTGTVLQITFDHEAFEDLRDVGIVTTAMQNLFANTGLF